MMGRSLDELVRALAAIMLIPLFLVVGLVAGFGGGIIFAWHMFTVMWRSGTIDI